MKVILTGTEGWAIDSVGRDLRQRGHEVRLCSEPDAAVFPCVGLSATAACPIDDGAEVIVTVRAHPIPEPTRREVSITCALLRGLPLVVAGSTVLNPFASIASAVVEGYEGIEAACRTVVDGRDRARVGAQDGSVGGGRPVDIRAAH
ncbi:MAG: hypothetical protein ACXWCM_13885 [Acidimicrobiales bacterium]